MGSGLNHRPGAPPRPEMAVAARRPRWKAVPADQTLRGEMSGRAAGDPALPAEADKYADHVRHHLFPEFVLGLKRELHAGEHFGELRPESALCAA